jgi:hypothetical protein
MTLLLGAGATQLRSLRVFLWLGLADIARPVIQRSFNPRLSFLELNGIL